MPTRERSLLADDVMYRAVETLQLPEAAEPLAPFVRELARSGEGTASCMYGKAGWVAAILSVIL